MTFMGPCKFQQKYFLSERRTQLILTRFLLHYIFFCFVRITNFFFSGSPGSPTFFFNGITRITNIFFDGITRITTLKNRQDQLGSVKKKHWSSQQNKLIYKEKKEVQTEKQIFANLCEFTRTEKRTCAN